MDKLLVKDWMTKDVITVKADLTLPDTAAIMKKNSIRRLPIVDDDGKLIGILSYTDVMAASPSNATTLDIWEINYLLSRITIDKLMTKDPLAVSPEQTIKEAAQIMVDRKIGGLPVVDKDHKVVGIITESDIFRLLITWLNGDIKAAL